MGRTRENGGGPGDRPVDAVDNSPNRSSGAPRTGPDPGREQGQRSGDAVHTPERLSDGGTPDDQSTPRDRRDGRGEAGRGPRPGRPRRRPRRERRAAGRGGGAAGIRKPVRRTGTGMGRPRRRGWSGSGADERDPQRLGRLASRLSGDRGWAPRLANGSVFGRWAELVGEEVAEHATSRLPARRRPHRRGRLDGLGHPAAPAAAPADREAGGRARRRGREDDAHPRPDRAELASRAPPRLGPRTARHVRLTVRAGGPTTGRQRRAGRLAAGRTLPMSIRAPCDALSRVPGPFWDG